MRKLLTLAAISLAISASSVRAQVDLSTYATPKDLSTWRP